MIFIPLLLESALGYLTCSGHWGNSKRDTETWKVLLHQSAAAPWSPESSSGDTELAYQRIRHMCHREQKRPLQHLVSPNFYTDMWEPHRSSTPRQATSWPARLAKLVQTQRTAQLAPSNKEKYMFIILSCRVQTWFIMPQRWTHTNQSVHITLWSTFPLSPSGWGKWGKMSKKQNV